VKKPGGLEAKTAVLAAKKDKNINQHRPKKVLGRIG